MNCPKCGHELSDRATMCPYCGADFAESLTSQQNAHRYCIHCGKELPESAKFCPKCGAKKETGAASVSPPSGYDETNTSSQPSPAPHAESAPTSNEQGRGLVKLLLIISLVCFIFPFATVSCGDISASVSGLEAMTSLTLQDDLDVYVSDRTPNSFLIIAFVLGVAAVCKVQGKSIKGSAIMATLGAICLLLFRFSFVSYYDLENYIDFVTLEFRWGWILSILSYATGAVLAWLYYWQELELSKTVPPKGTETVTTSQPPSSDESVGPPPSGPASNQSDEADQV